MKTNQISLIAVPILALLASCSSSPESVTPDENEEYTREFISKFGVPASGHDYSMATSAGLKVTTANGSHVTVTAFVGDTEYLFADLSVPAGTHAIPVTIPRSVTELKVNTNGGTQIVSPNAIVNLDETLKDETPKRLATDKGFFKISNPDDTQESEGVMIVTPDNDVDGFPYLAFDPKDFLKPYLDKHLNKEGTTTNNEKNGTQTSPSYPYLKHSGETIFSTVRSSAGYCYYIFPIWWRRAGGKSDGVKDYETHLFKVKNGTNNLTSDYIPPFKNEDIAKDIPFPNLGYSNDNLSRNEIDLNKLSEQFVYDNGSFDKAFDVDNAKMVISRGVRVWMTHTDAYTCPRFALYVKNTNGDYFSSTAPFYNANKWNGNYYNVELDNLYNAMVSTLDENLNSYGNANGKVYIKSPDYNYKKKWDFKNGKIGGDDTGTWSESEGDFVCKNTGYNHLIGFSANASERDDDSMRDYCDVIFLVTPAGGNDAYTHQYYVKPKPYQWTIAAEDLGGSLDWDFNDAVLTFTDVVKDLKSENKHYYSSVLSGPISAQAVREITVKPLAAGGTLPLYITYTGEKIYTMPELQSSGETKFSEANNAIIAHFNNSAQSGTFILGTEIHKWLGASTHTHQLNAGASRQDMNAAEVKFALPIETVPDDYQMIHNNATSGENLPVCGFSIIVDKDNTLNIDVRNDKGFKHMEDANWGSGIYQIGKPNQAKDQIAPQMLLVTGDWEWPQEGINILEAYPTFNNWVTSPSSAQDWNTNPTDGKITKK